MGSHVSKSSCLLFVCLLLAGCTAASPIYIDEDVAQVLVVRGHIKSGQLYRWGKCEASTEFLQVQCGPGRDSTASFIVKEPIVGISPSRVHTRFGYSSHWPELKVGDGAQYLAVFITDGAPYKMIGIAPVSRTEDGSWAIPIALDRETHLFPCSLDDREPESLRFRSPMPGELRPGLSRDAELAADLQTDGWYTVKGSHVYANRGVPLKHAAAAYAGKSAERVKGECH